MKFNALMIMIAKFNLFIIAIDLVLSKNQRITEKNVM